MEILTYLSRRLWSNRYKSDKQPSTTTHQLVWETGRKRNLPSSQMTNPRLSLRAIAADNLIANRQLSIKNGIILALIAGLWLICACESQTDRTEKSRIHYQRGLRYVKEVNMQEAILEMKFAIHLDPSFETPYYQLGIIFQKIGGFENAIGYFRAFLKFQPDHLDTHIRLARICDLNGRYKEAINEAEYIINRVPINSEIAIEMHNILGSIYLYKYQNYEAATYHYKKVWDKRPNELDPYISFAQYYLENEEIEKAFKMIDKALVISPKNMIILNMLSAFYQKKKDWNNLIDIYRKIIEYYPNKKDLKIILAELFLKLKRYPEAKALAFKIYKKDTRDLRMHFILGEVAFQQKDHEKALEHFSYLETANYRINDILSRLGTLFMATKRYKKAMECYENLIFTRPDIFEAQYYFTLLALKNKKYKKAERAAFDLKKRFYKFNEADFYLGKAQFFQENFLDVIIYLERYHKIGDEEVTKSSKYNFYKIAYPTIVFPEKFYQKNRAHNQVESRYFLGVAYLMQDLNEKAIEQFEKLIFEEPNLPLGFVMAAIAYHRLGQYNEALNHCRMTEVLVGTDKAMVNFVMANIYASQLDLEKAQLFFKRSDDAIYSFNFSNVDVTSYHNPKKPNSLADLSMAALVLRNNWREKAKELCERVLTDNPDNPIANYIIDNMYILVNEYYKNLTQIGDQIERITIPEVIE